MIDFLVWAVAAFVRWFRLKVYQYEVTFAVYMLTPTEKFIFNSVLLSLVSMIVTGAYIYLPDHIRAIYGHLYYYWVGDRPLLSTTNLPSFTSVFRDASAQNFGMMYDTAKNTAAATTESIVEL